MRPGHRFTTRHAQAIYPFMAAGGLGGRGVFIGRQAAGALGYCGHIDPGVPGMRAYLNGVAEGLTAAPRMVALFAAHARRLERELAALRVRQAYTAAKVALWRARVEGDRAAEQEAAAEVLRVMGQLRDHDKETHR